MSHLTQFKAAPFKQQNHYPWFVVPRTKHFASCTLAHFAWQHVWDCYFTVCSSCLELSTSWFQMQLAGESCTLPWWPSVETVLSLLRLLRSGSLILSGFSASQPVLWLFFEILGWSHCLEFSVLAVSIVTVRGWKGCSVPTWVYNVDSSYKELSTACADSEDRPQHLAIHEHTYTDAWDSLEYVAEPFIHIALILK